jgi:allantoinase
MLRKHERYQYSPIAARPDWNWPDGKRLAFYCAIKGCQTPSASGPAKR